MPALRLAALILFVTPIAACAQTPSDDDRRARIAENLQFRFEQLQGVPVEVVELGDSDVPGMDIGTLMIAGQNQMRFLVTEDDTQLFLLAAEPVDVSMTGADLEAQRAEMAQAESREARQRHAQLMALSRQAPSLGPDDAPVTVIEFSDFQCPFCARVVPTVKELLARYPEQVRVVFLDFPLNMHPWAEPAAIAAGCAARQSNAAFWSLHDYYFEAQGDITTANVIANSRRHLADTGINMEQWEVCATDQDSDAYTEVQARMRMSMNTAQSLGATGTPAFFINGRFLSGAQPIETFEEVVEQALADLD